MPNITGHFTCDNSYSVWVGDADQVMTKLLEATNTQAGQIWGGEDLPEIEPVPECHLYICAWSDDVIYQGLLGSFTGAVTIHSGDPRWRVLPTGANKGNNQFPTAAEINAAIAASQPTDWKVPAVGATNGGPPWNQQIQGVAVEAQWMWHDSGKDVRAKYPDDPYVPFAGFNHDEFLIFRYPCAEFEEPTDGQVPADTADCKCCVVVNCGSDCDPKPNCAPCCCPPTPEVARFDVYMSRLRVLKNRELKAKAELMITGYANGQSAVFPGNGLWVQLHKKWGWRIINKRVAEITIEKGTTRVVSVMADAIEADTIAAGSWEMGSGSGGSLSLTSGQGVGTDTVKVDLHRVKDVNAGTVSAQVEVEFTAYEVTP